MLLWLKTDVAGPFRLLVVDEAGAPVPGAAAVVIHGDRRSTIEGDERGRVELDTDLRGERLHVVITGPPGAPLLPYSASRTFISGERIVLPRALTIAGSVQAPNGRPVPFATLVHTREGVATRIDLDDAGRFELGGLPSGPVVLRASLHAPSRPDARTVTKTVAAGSRHVVLTIDLEPLLEIHIAGWPRGVANVDCQLSVQAAGAGLGRGAVPGGAITRPIDSEGRVQFHALSHQARYRVFVHLPTHESYVLENLLSPATEPHEVPLRRGSSMTGELRGMPRNVDQFQIDAFSADLQLQVAGDVDDTAAFRVMGVPPGPWVLRASAWAGSRAYFGETSVREVPARGIQVDLK